MKFTKIIATLAIAGLVLVSCKKEEDKNLANIKAVEATPKEHKAIAAENVQTASFEIEGMTCAMGCAKTIEKELTNLDGIISFIAALASGVSNVNNPVVPI